MLETSSLLQNSNWLLRSDFSVCVKAVVFRAHLEAVYTNLTLKNQSSLMPVIVITDTSARQPLKGFAAASRVYKCCLNKPQDFGIGEQR